jgi:[acyl-carrier-protein] S-malonyltransferase
VEVGPGTVLTGLIKRILPDAKLLNVNDPKSLELTLTALTANQ